MSGPPVTRARATLPDPPRRRDSIPQAPPQGGRERAERFSFNPNDSELDIPTFLRHRGE
jgi:hypothetical protein